MAERFKAPRGTFDVLPEQEPLRRRIHDAARRALEAAGYGRIETPIFEDTELFARGVGESTDIVQKEMFTFEDQGRRSLTLRPEATASIAGSSEPNTSAPTCVNWRKRPACGASWRKKGPQYQSFTG